MKKCSHSSPLAAVLAGCAAAILAAQIISSTTACAASEPLAEETNYRLRIESYTAVCGPFSVSVVLHAMGKPTPFDEVSKGVEFDPERGRTSLRTMQRYLESRDLHTVFIRGSAGDVLKYNVPVILGMRMPGDSNAPDVSYHFVAAIPSPEHNGKYYLFDGDKAKPFNAQELQSSPVWTGQALLVSPTKFEYQWPLWNFAAVLGVGAGAFLMCLGLWSIGGHILAKRAKQSA